MSGEFSYFYDQKPVPGHPEDGRTEDGATDPNINDLRLYEAEYMLDAPPDPSTTLPGNEGINMRQSGCAKVL